MHQTSNFANSLPTCGKFLIKSSPILLGSTNSARWDFSTAQRSKKKRSWMSLEAHMAHWLRGKGSFLLLYTHHLLFYGNDQLFLFCHVDDLNGFQTLWLPATNLSKMSRVWPCLAAGTQKRVLGLEDKKRKKIWCQEKSTRSTVLQDDKILVLEKRECYWKF